MEGVVGEGGERGKLRTRKHKKDRDRQRARRHRRDRRFEDSEDRDDVSCCGRPRKKSDSRRRRHSHRRRRSKSRRYEKDRSEAKDDIPSSSRPAGSSLSQQPLDQAAGQKEKPKEEKESCEMTSTNQGKRSTSAEISGQGKSNIQMGTSRSPPALASQDRQKVNGRESVNQMITNKAELLQELCVTQCIRDGYEISRMAFVVNGNISDEQKKSTQPGGMTDLSQEMSQPNDNCKNQLPHLLKGKDIASKAKVSNFVENLNECCLALQKARKNIANLKLLVSGERLSEVHRYDIDTKAIINNLKRLQQHIDGKFTT
ncbi:unnamed protein product [Litomosoides sigmodontis]|uniref:Uncharacterized protein n=1 Tax=Litomosoides sigmodontis TaxID=42156 RepID=A0A3P6ST22_LITSI|nr:unnamed protein product [Litomosoides sigmodontis]